MTRKDYTILANAMRQAAIDIRKAGGSTDGIIAMRERIADALAADNERFDRMAFVAACDF